MAVGDRYGLKFEFETTGAQKFQRDLSAANREIRDVDSSSTQAKQSAGAMGAGMVVAANQALELAQKAIQAARAIREFAMAGVDAARVAQQFSGDLDALRRASGNAIDDTTLQRLDIMAKRTGLANKEVQAFTRVATKFARQEGREMAEVFQQLIDASPEQLEKWGILTSELVEQMKGLDTVQQKQALRQALVAEGMRITNEEIADGTHALERQGAQWDNFVSSLQEGAAAMLNSEGVSDALQKVTEDIANATNAIVTALEKWDSLLETMGEAVGIEDVGLASFFKVGWETSVIANIARAEVAYRNFLRYVREGAVVGAAADRADYVLTAQRAMQADKIEGAISDQARLGFAAADVDPDAATLAYFDTTFDFEDEPPKTPGARRKPLGDGLGIESFLSGLGPGFGADGSADFLGNIFTADEGGKAIRAIGSQIADGMREAGTEVGMLVQSLDELAQKQAELAKQTEDSLATQIEAYANLGSQGVASVGAWAAAFGASQKEMSYIRFGVESFEAIAAAARYDFWAASQHAAAATGALLVATGAFDGGGSGAGGAARAGGRAAGSGISRSTFGPTANLGAADEMPDRTVIQLQVDGRKLGEEAMRGANQSARTYRRRTTLDARAVNRGMGRSFP